VVVGNGGVIRPYLDDGITVAAVFYLSVLFGGKPLGLDLLYRTMMALLVSLFLLGHHFLE
jgi:hypothetical protein